MTSKALKGVLMVMLVVLCVSVSACLVRIPVGMNAVDAEDVYTYYDDPVRGWYVEGYWTGGCLGCGIWVSPFWTTDTVVIYNHWGHYRGRHYSDLHRHFGRYGGFTHGGYRHHQYIRDRDRYRGRDHRGDWRGDRSPRNEHFKHQGHPRNERQDRPPASMHEPQRDQNNNSGHMRPPTPAHEPQRGQNNNGRQIQRPHRNEQPRAIDHGRHH
ncbi:MAG: hypothetical protein Q8L47_01040 [bacterium]|nr:hypothetical protein [bacterium]